MRRQAAAHLDHLQVSLQDQAKSLTEEWRNQLETELRAQAAHHSKQVDSFSEKIRVRYLFLMHFVCDGVISRCRSWCNSSPAFLSSAMLTGRF